MLKHELPNLTLFFDIEWVPDAESSRRMFDLPPETTESDAIQHLWERTAGYSEDRPRPFVKYLYSRVVSIAFLSREGVWRDGSRCIEFKLNTLPTLPLADARADEAYLIERFLYYTGEREPTLVGYNSQESDLQVLIQRGLIHGISAEKFCRRPPKPWEGRDYFVRYGEDHLDILSLLSNGQMKPQLNELSRLCGFPGKPDVDGQHVVDMWLAGDLKRIVDYNQIDVLNTYLLWLRLVHFCGKLSTERYDAEQATFRDFLEAEAEKPDNEHIRSFLDKWPPPVHGA